MNEVIDLRNDPLYLKVYALLKRWILDGRLGPGERLRESTLAAELQVSRTPIRDALRRLEQDRLVVSLPGAAYEVHRPTLQDVDDLFAARAVLESGAARLAATRCPEAIHEMGDTLVRMAGAYDQCPQPEVLELDMRFHELLVAASGNPVLVELNSHLNIRLRHIRSLSGDILVRQQLVLEQHAAILQALKDRDGAAAEKATHDHIISILTVSRSSFMAT